MNLRRLLKVLRVASVAASFGLLLSCAVSRPPVEPEPVSIQRGLVSQPQTVAMLGATGMAGGYLLREALARGYEVRALARTPDKLAELRDQLTIVQGDARDPLVIQELLQGADVVISALGPVKADGDAARFVNSVVTANILREMEGRSISQYMIVSGAAVVMPGDRRNLLGWWMRKLVQLSLWDTLKDKQSEYELLAASSANWMLVRCPLIDPEPYRSGPQVSLETPPAFHLRAGELARFMVDQIEARQYLRQGPFLGSE